MANTLWSEWYYCDRFLGKPYPFIDNYPRLKRINKKSDEKKGLTKKLNEQTEVKK